jgi:hypothetical protein
MTECHNAVLYAAGPINDPQKSFTVVAPTSEQHWPTGAAPAQLGLSTGGPPTLAEYVRKHYPSGIGSYSYTEPKTRESELEARVKQLEYQVQVLTQALSNANAAVARAHEYGKSWYGRTMMHADAPLHPAGCACIACRAVVM